MGQKLIIIIATTILLFTGLLLGYVLSQLVLGFLQLNLLTFLGTISLLLIFGTLYYVLFRELRGQQPRTSPGRTSLPPTNSPNSTTSINSANSTNQRSVNTLLRNRLINMLDGDINAAELLVEQIRQDYPARPENWYWEKAIADLERDRR